MKNAEHQFSLERLKGTRDVVNLRFNISKSPSHVNTVLLFISFPLFHPPLPFILFGFLLCPHPFLPTPAVQPPIVIPWDLSQKHGGGGRGGSKGHLATKILKCCTFLKLLSAAFFPASTQTSAYLPPSKFWFRPYSSKSCHSTLQLPQLVTLQNPHAWPRWATIPLLWNWKIAIGRAGELRVLKDGGKRGQAYLTDRGASGQLHGKGKKEKTWLERYFSA